MDFTKPGVARVHNTLLGGRDNFAVDRELAAELTAIGPIAGDLAAESRSFVMRAVTWAAQAGIGQYLDLGCGLPHRPAVHETAREVIPSARVAYVDHDPLVLAHGRALFTAPGLAVIGADLTAPATGFFGGLELVEPGLTEARAWHPGRGAHRVPRHPAHILAGVGRKPA